MNIHKQVDLAQHAVAELLSPNRFILIAHDEVTKEVIVGSGDKLNNEANLKFIKQLLNHTLKTFSDGKHKLLLTTKL